VIQDSWGVKRAAYQDHAKRQDGDDRLPNFGVRHQGTHEQTQGLCGQHDQDHGRPICEEGPGSVPARNKEFLREPGRSLVDTTGTKGTLLAVDVQLVYLFRRKVQGTNASEAMSYRKRGSLLTVAHKKTLEVLSTYCAATTSLAQNRFRSRMACGRHSACWNGPGLVYQRH
jgi:hypothetical protein